MDRLFVQQYFQLHLNFNGIVNYTLNSGFSGSGLIPIGIIPHWKHTPFSIWLFKMDVTYSTVSFNTGEIIENNRRDIVINYCKTLDTDFSSLQKTLINFSHLHDNREL